jgi:WD40 repeat protein
MIGLFPAVSGLHHSAPAGRPAAHGRFKGMGGHGDSPFEVAFSPNGKILATADSDGTARLWNVATQRQIGTAIRLHGPRVNGIAFSPGGKVLATAESDGTVRLWNVASHRQIGAPIVAGKTGVVDLAFSPDGKRLAISVEGSPAWLWNVSTRHRVGKPIDSQADARFGLFVEFSPNGKLLMTIGFDATIRLWSLSTFREVGKPIGSHFGGPVNGAAFSPNGKLIGTAGRSYFKIWSVTTQKQVSKNMPVGGFSAEGVGFTPDSKVLVTTDADGTIAQWSVATSEQVEPVIAPKGHPLFGDEAVSPDGKLLATTQSEGPAQLWRLGKP